MPAGEISAIFQKNVPVKFEGLFHATKHVGVRTLGVAPVKLSNPGARSSR